MENELPPPPPPSRREQAIAELERAHNKIQDRLDLLFKEIPDDVLREEIAEGSLTVSQLPDMLNKAHSRLGMLFNLIRRNPDTPPSDLVMDNIKAILRNMLLVQGQLKMLGEVYSAEGRELEVDTAEYEWSQVKVVNANARDKEHFLLDKEAQKTFAGIYGEMRNYIVGASRLLGVSVQLALMMENSSPDKPVMHHGIHVFPDGEALAPPKSWAERTKEVKLSIAVGDSK